MNLNMDFYSRLGTIQWLSHCGEILHSDLGRPVEWVDDRTAALQFMFSPQWADALTIGQGRLTSYLAKQDYDAYGRWNTLAKESRTHVDVAAGARLVGAIRSG